jgi:hypothetical protein
MQRRHFLRTLSIGTTAVLANRLSAAEKEKRGQSSTLTPTRYAEWLAARHERVVTRECVEAFLQPPPNNQWAKFDPQLGYVPSDSIQRDGIDGARSIYRYGPAGERKMINYADRPCRVNTYGNSFTHCHQVSDGETWQEHLAAHLGEPIRNFGVGGYGVFQAFFRLRRMEQTRCQATYLIFNIFDDDHQRSLMPWRGLVINWHGSAEMFHATPWPHLRVNLDSGLWEEAPNPCPSPESLRELLSCEHTCALMADHEIVQLRAMMEGVSDVPQERIRRLADWAKLKFDFTDVATRRESAAALVETVARKSTFHVLEKLREFAQRHGQKLMVVLSRMSRTLLEACSGEPKAAADVALLEWLKERSIPCVDSLDAHKEDFAQFRVAPSAYVKRYYRGHYSPRGNQFFAFAIKNAVVEWLDPKPMAYQTVGTIVDFQDGRYLEKPPRAGSGNR